MDASIGTSLDKQLNWDEFVAKNKKVMCSRNYSKPKQAITEKNWTDFVSASKLVLPVRKFRCKTTDEVFMKQKHESILYFAKKREENAKLRFAETGQQYSDEFIPGCDGSGDSNSHSTRTGIIVQGSNGGSRVYPSTLGFPMFPAPGKVVNQELDVPIINQGHRYEAPSYSTSVQNMQSSSNVILNNARNVGEPSREVVPMCVFPLNSQLQNPMNTIDYSNECLTSYRETNTATVQQIPGNMQLAPNCGQNMYTLGQQMPSYEQCLPKYDDSLQSYQSAGQNVATSYQNTSNYGQNIANYSQSIAMVGQNMPNYDNCIPQYGLTSTNYDNSMTNYWQTLPVSGQSMPINDYLVPGYNTNSEVMPSYEHSMPNFTNGDHSAVSTVRDSIDVQPTQALMPLPSNSVVSNPNKAMVTSCTNISNQSQSVITRHVASNSGKLMDTPEQLKNTYKSMQRKFENMMVISSPQVTQPAAIPSLLSIITTPFIPSSELNKAENCAQVNDQDDDDDDASSLPSLESTSPPPSWMSSGVSTRRGLDAKETDCFAEQPASSVNQITYANKVKGNSVKPPPGLSKTSMSMSFAEIARSNSDYSMYNSMYKYEMF